MEPPIMPYVSRRPDNTIYGQWATIQYDGQEWLDEGHPDLSTPPPIPRIVTMRQARLALSRSGLLTTVNGALATMAGTEGEEARIEWEFSGTVERDKALVQSLATALGITDMQLDELFMLAASL
jgi:hypothetical protein